MSKINLFNSVKLTRPKANKFDLTHDVKMSTKMGILTPSLVLECVPGDKINIGIDTFVRMAPMIAPIMHKVDVYCHTFFVPNRILWDDWENFITNQESGAIPQITITDSLSPEAKKLLDYLGIPPCPTGGQPTNVTAFALAAYQCIYSEYYRDQNLVPEVNWKLQSGLNVDPDLFQLRYRAWEHDYFTASLPFAQKGDAVDIPLGQVEINPDWSTAGSTPNFRKADGTEATLGTVGVDAQNDLIVNQTIGGTVKTAYDPDGSLQVGSTTINDLRRAFRLQEFLERMARGGSRYIEVILSHFGVRSSDARLQRPEYITGVKTPVVISEVLNTTGIEAELPQGTMAGHGVAVGTGYNGYYSVEEHGYIIGIMSIMPKPAYQQGIHRTFLKTDPLEYYWPTFAHIGEQEVLTKEIFAYDTGSEELFGYVPRYAEYKYLASRVAGDFRTTLDFWHLGRKFGAIPTLSQEFIEVRDEDVERIFAVQDGTDNIYCHVLNKISAIRLMPVFGTPML